MTTKISLEVLEDNSVTEAKLVSSSVTEAKLASNSVTASKIAAGAVGASEIAAGAVGSSELASGSVTNAKVASGIDAAKLTGTLPALNGSNLTGIEPPTDRNAIGTYRLYFNNTTQSKVSSLGTVGSTFSNSYGFTGTWRIMDIINVGYNTGAIGQTTYDVLTLVVRVS